MTARDQIHRLVDALPDDDLEVVGRMLSGLSAPRRPGNVRTG